MPLTLAVPPGSARAEGSEQDLGTQVVAVGLKEVQSGVRWNSAGTRQVWELMEMKSKAKQTCQILVVFFRLPF